MLRRARRVTRHWHHPGTDTATYDGNRPHDSGSPSVSRWRRLLGKSPCWRGPEQRLHSEDEVGHVVLPVAYDLVGVKGETFSNLASGVSSIVTTVAVLIGGIWAYRKFVQGRTFKPRLSASMNAQWHLLPDVGHVLRVRIDVKNIGASRMILTPRGTGLTIAFPAERQTTEAHRSTDEWWPDIRWETVRKMEGSAQTRTFVVLKEHRWIEPGEAISDELLLNLGREPTMARLEVKLVWRVPRWWWKDKNIRFVTRQIIPPEPIVGKDEVEDEFGREVR